MTVFGGKLGKNAPNMAFFWRASSEERHFLFIYSKSAKNKMSFEIHVTTYCYRFVEFVPDKLLSFSGR